MILYSYYSNYDYKYYIHHNWHYSLIMTISNYFYLLLTLFLASIAKFDGTIKLLFLQIHIRIFTHRKISSIIIILMKLLLSMRMIAMLRMKTQNLMNPKIRWMNESGGFLKWIVIAPDAVTDDHRQCICEAYEMLAKN